MNTRGENVDERAVGGDGPVRRPRFAALVAVTAALVATLLGAAAAPAFAATDGAGTSRGLAASTPAPTTTPGPQNQLTPLPGTPTPTRPPVRPTITDPGDITSGTVRFSGTGTPGHALVVAGPAATGSTGCQATVRDDGSWSCLASVRSGPQQVFTVQDRTTPAVGSASAPASDVVVPPIVTTSRPTNGPVSGTGYPGSTITLSVSGSTTDRTATVGRDGRWTASFGSATPGAGGDARLSVTAIQTASTAGGYRSDLRSAASAPVTITLDRTAPAAPRITAPSSGDRVRTQPTTVSGTGEPGALLTVYVDRAPVCRTDVPASGRWSCSTAGSTLRAGPRGITAAQQDAAGNFSTVSASVRVSVTRASAGPTGPAGDPTSGSAGSNATSSGPATPGVHDGPGSSPGPTGGAGTGTGTTGGTGGTGSTGDAGGSGTSGDGIAAAGGHGRGLDWSGPAGDWTASTAYDTTMPTIQSAFSWRTVLVATAVAGGFLVLIAGPLALVAGAARGRLRTPFGGLLGRNRPRDERRRGEDVLPTWASITVAVLVVGLCTVLGVGVSLEARYVRLAIAILLGAAVLTTAIVLTGRWAAGTDRSTIGFRVSPWLVLAALVACGITRTFDLSPALIVGVVLVPVGRPDLDTAALRLGSSIAAGARSATWRSVALLVVAAAGWVLHSLTPGTGFWVSFVSEFAITLCVGGLGAVVVTLLPLPGSAGQALLAQSRGRYVAIASVAVALAAAVYSGAEGSHVSPVALAIVAAVCTAGAVGARLWLRNARAEPQA
ncbi:hypothetical protein GCM10017714_17800 [Curtobacterium pusillum]|uniref:Bacterial Ig domain-containing protein n=1 Tax=Curtobacterium pusillum TaxID=69373 RepID=A0ABX2M9Q0_9MICO|nr:hypothetical protein [Curtobacterium pusillum]NUU14379.1 hypothetical protein [Curtobacterium pusillum]GLK31041.1 hypothetical protein GCM10017610_13260 [Curtobacterium pusillum]